MTLADESSSGSCRQSCSPGRLDERRHTLTHNKSRSSHDNWTSARICRAPSTDQPSLLHELLLWRPFRETKKAPGGFASQLSPQLSPPAMFDHKGHVRASPSMIDGDALVLVPTAMLVPSRTSKCNEKSVLFSCSGSCQFLVFLGGPERRLRALCKSTSFLSPTQTRGSKAITLHCGWQGLTR